MSQERRYYGNINHFNINIFYRFNNNDALPYTQGKYFI